MANDQHCLMNRKPYRDKYEKVRARKKARKCKDGAYRCTLPTQRHANCPCGDKYSPGNHCFARKTREKEKGLEDS